MHLLEKLWKMSEKVEILKLSQQKEEDTIWCQNKIIILQKTKFSTEILLAIEMKKLEIFMNKPADLGLSILVLRKIVI